MFRIYFLKNNFNITLPSTPVYYISGFFLSCFRTKTSHSFLFPFMRKHAQPIFYLTILMIFDAEYKLSNASLRNFFQTPITLSFLGPNILSRQVKVRFEAKLHVSLVN